MANITALLAALSNLPPMTGAPPLTPLPGTAQPPTDFVLPQMLAGPQAPPPSPAMPLDRNLINQYLSFAGPPPTPPPAQAPPSFVDKLAAALSGISAGIQGRGPELAAQIREERQRPQREYEARQQQYEQNRRQLGVRGFEAAQSAEERRQAREDRAAENQFNRDFQEFTRRNNITDQTALEKMREGAQAQRLKDQQQELNLREDKKYKEQQQRDARLFASKFSAQGAKGGIAKELGDYYAGVSDQLSPEAAKWESASAQANQIRARREARLEGGGGRGGGGSSLAAQKALAQFEDLKQQVASAQARGDAQAEMQLTRTRNAAFNRLSRFPGQFDLGYDQNGMPYAKPRGTVPQPAAPPPGFHAPMALPDQSGGQMYFDLSGKAPSTPQINRAQAKAKLIANGYKPAEAEAELNRLGIR